MRMDSVDTVIITVLRTTVYTWGGITSYGRRPGDMPTFGLPVRRQAPWRPGPGEGSPNGSGHLSSLGHDAAADTTGPLPGTGDCNATGQERSVNAEPLPVRSAPAGCDR